MRRMGIFVFYDKTGKVDGYIEFLLNSMQTILDRLIIVVNGEITFESKERLRKYSQDIFIRKNLGYDGGAYKDTILYYLENEDWSLWDELILFNDTFYGPFSPWSKIFQRMEKEEIDFWGLSKHLGGKRVFKDGSAMPVHIQGYFLVCNKTMITSKLFMYFWEDLKYPKTYNDAVEDFEVGFSTFFIKGGFKCKSFIEVSNPQFELTYAVNPYLQQSFEIIKYADFPVVKKKALSICYFSATQRIIEYIKNETDYDIMLIKENMERLEKENRILPFTRMEVNEFYEKHERIYIYGHGIYAKGLTEYFLYKKWKVEKYIVSEKNNSCSDTICINDVNLDVNDGIIVALGEIAFREVCPIICEKFNEQQVLVPRYYF